MTNLEVRVVAGRLIDLIEAGKLNGAHAIARNINARGDVPEALAALALDILAGWWEGTMEDWAAEARRIHDGTLTEEEVPTDLLSGWDDDGLDVELRPRLGDEEEV